MALRLTPRGSFRFPPYFEGSVRAHRGAIQALFGGSRQSLCAFVAPDHSAGRRFKTAAMPIRLGPDGIAHIEDPGLNAHDRVALENAISL